jgi:hypothetical protein
LSWLECKTGNPESTFPPLKHDNAMTKNEHDDVFILAIDDSSEYQCSIVPYKNEIRLLVRYSRFILEMTAGVKSTIPIVLYVAHLNPDELMSPFILSQVGATSGNRTFFTNNENCSPQERDMDIRCKN